MHPSPPRRAATDAASPATRIAARFRERRFQGYARGKLRFDPVFEALVPLLADSPLPLLDIGCGLGLLGFRLREAGWAGGYLGIDLDARKIAAARAAAAGLEGLRFEAADAASLPPFAGHVALIDVLHYLDREAQQRLLAEAARRLAPGGLLLIRSVLREPRWRFHATLAEEWLIRTLRWIGTPARHYPARAELERPLATAGLAVTVAPLWGRTPFASHLITARRTTTA